MNGLKLAQALRKLSALESPSLPSSPSPAMPGPKLTTSQAGGVNFKTPSIDPNFAAHPSGVATPALMPTPGAGQRIPAIPVSSSAMAAPQPTMRGEDNKPQSTANVVKAGSDAGAFIRQKLRDSTPKLPEAPSLKLPDPPQPTKAFEAKKPPSTKDFRMGSTEGTT